MGKEPRRGGFLFHSSVVHNFFVNCLIVSSSVLYTRLSFHPPTPPPSFSFFFFLTVEVLCCEVAGNRHLPLVPVGQQLLLVVQKLLCLDGRGWVGGWREQVLSFE